MRRHTLTAAGILGLSALVTLTGCAGGSAEAAPAASSDPDAPITFATTPLGDDPAANPVTAFAELLREETGREVEVVDVPDYTAVLEALRNHHVDIGFMSGFPSALAVNTGEIDSIVAWEGNGEPVSTCIVLDESELQSFDDITPDTVVAFADPASSSGYFMPVAALHEAGLEKDVDYTALFAGDHFMGFEALKQGQADVSCTSTIFPGMAGTDMFPFEEGDTRSIGVSAAMPLSVTVLADQQIAADKAELLKEVLPKVFVEENAERLGAMFSAIEGGAAIVDPSEELFQPFVDIAAIADVDISDLG
ncbi:PhnD/SsuA/transferrin family substrate-binding protein [Microbacterium marinilacus]|uniref:Phosphate/phosphite/phosphonate ABC transporter substrate-binding protein n=1 Tax=Microbacterium marinilacus TaxID=415209 RepID=A0ABP7BQ51_9MICO|nr:PhnD/SsuA/transferrin family substrate-binding protein [Microbacterium marinilacus]MBY0689887.1 PhnD/SsuA/transferrin family substrate-binding protein [Microbacterium marinilacus]